MGDIFTTVVLILLASTLAWWLFWGAVGYFLARERGGSPILGAVLAIVLGPIGVIIILVITRNTRHRSANERSDADDSSPADDGRVDQKAVDDLFGDYPG